MKNLIAAFIGSVLVFPTLSQIGHSQTTSFGDAVAGWAQACGKDVDTYCKGVKPGNNRLASCLVGKASPICQSATTRLRPIWMPVLPPRRKHPKYARTTFRLNPNRIVAMGLGEEQLFDLTDPNDGVNRRVELVNIGPS